MGTDILFKALVAPMAGMKPSSHPLIHARPHCKVENSDVYRTST